MKQPPKKGIKINIKNNKKKAFKSHPKVGTSKLEVKFMNEFLERLGVKYIYQFEITSIKRFFDFYLPEENLIIEVDGDYFHTNPLKYPNGPINNMQKRNKKIDELKEKWALLNGIPILRIWENDIINNPSHVLSILNENILNCKNKNLINENKKKRH